jgi:mRNA-degrading endonuclease toxin of MazEF toxin-antitoxin module
VAAVVASMAYSASLSSSSQIHCHCQPGWWHPTSTSARPASFRPEIVIAGATTRVLAEKTAAVDPERLGEQAGHLTHDVLQRVNAALRIVLEL